MHALICTVPQIIYFILMSLGTLGFIMVSLTSPLRETLTTKETRYNPVAAFLGVLLQFGLFFWGGFYHEFQLPQIIVTFGLIAALFDTSNLVYTKNKILVMLYRTSCSFTLLYFGGFFGY
jgi:hypothetical protein